MKTKYNTKGEILMYGHYVCSICGAEVDPNELHNGICDDCLEKEREENNNQSESDNKDTSYWEVGKII